MTPTVVRQPNPQPKEVQWSELLEGEPFVAQFVQSGVIGNVLWVKTGSERYMDITNHVHEAPYRHSSYLRLLRVKSLTVEADL